MADKLESALEEFFFNLVRRKGGEAVKLYPSKAGVPDRLVLWPGGHKDLVELKKVGGSLRPIQEVWHARMRRKGHRIPVLEGEAEIGRWVNARAREIESINNARAHARVPWEL